jgi:hypothetical protein
MADRRYTTAELDAMDQQAAASDAPAEALSVAPPDTERRFSSGVGTSVDRTILGLKQAYQYLAGDDEGRQKVNEAILALEARKSAQSTAERMGEAFGTAMQFAGPQMGAGALAKLAPRALVKGVQMFSGVPGSTGRAAATGAAFEASQPVAPSDLSTEEFVRAKGVKTGLGAAGGAVAGKLANVLTSKGVPVPADRQAMVAEAERMGIPLTPAERTGNRDLALREAYLSSHRGSGGQMAKIRDDKQAIMNQEAARAIGSEAAAPTEAVLAERTAIANKGYEPIAAIQNMPMDGKYVTALDDFMAKQGKRAVGSDEALKVAAKMKAGAGTQNGGEFLEDLQGLRDLSFSARQRGEPTTSKQLSELSNILEDYAERQVSEMAKAGVVPANAMATLKAARAERAKIHAVEAATDPVMANVNPNKYLKTEFKRQKPSSGPGRSAVAEGLRDAGSVARVLRQSAPPISSSGTAERLEGGAGGILNAGKNYLAAKMHLKFGGRGGPLGAVLPQRANMFTRRMLPGAAFGTEEGMD